MQKGSIKPKLTAEDIQTMAAAVARLNADPSRPNTVCECHKALGRELGLTPGQVRARCNILGLRVTAAPGFRPKPANPWVY